MRNVKNNLYDLGKAYISKGIQNSYLFDRMHKEQISKMIFDRYHAEEQNFRKMEQGIDIKNIKKVILSPQINNILVSYLTYTISLSVYNIISRTGRNREFLIGDINEYVLNVIEEYFSDISEKEIIAIKVFLENLSNCCTADENITELNARMGAIGIMNNYTFQANSGWDFSNTIKKINYGLKNEFIPNNPKYCNTLEKYMKVLKQYYSMQFVYMLGDCRFTEFYIPPLILSSIFHREFLYVINELDEDGFEKLQNEWKNIFIPNDIIYIVGGPGFGKSLFLRYILNNNQSLSLNNCMEYLFIYCDLKAFYSRGKVNKKSILDFLQETMISITGMDEDEISKKFVKYYLDLGRCVVLLDALDEVPKEFREELHKKLLAFFSECNPNNKICITSRDRGFLPKENIVVLEICPLTTRDIEKYLDKMIALKKFKKDDKKNFLEQAQILIEKGFLNNFLALSLLVSIYRSENKLPENKTNLYKKCFEYIAREREIEEKKGTGFNWENIAPIMKDSTFISLSTLGVPNNKDINRKDVEKLLISQYKMKYNDEAKTECAVKEFLEFCSNRTELFVPATSDDKFKFFHRSFFEYFYSRYIHQCSTVEEMYDLMIVFDVDSEVFELTVALVKEDNEVKYQKLVTYLIQKAEEGLSGENVSYMAFHILTLVMQVIDDKYFKQLYFELIIKYNSKFIMKDVHEFNHKLILDWVIYSVENSKENLEQFRVSYEISSLIYFINLLSNITTKKEVYPFIVENVTKVRDAIPDDKRYLPIFSNTDFFSEYRNKPFYVSAYGKYFNVFDKLEEYSNLPSKDIYLKIGSSSQVRKIKKVLKRYKSYDENKRINLCDLITKL